MGNSPAWRRRLRRSGILLLALPKSLIFSASYFGIANALRLPAIIGHRVKLASLGGRIVVEGPLHAGMLQIGMTGVLPFAYDQVRTVWDNHGTVTLRGRATIGGGSKLSILPGAELVLGSDFVINARSDLFCGKRIEFGAGCLLSWDVLVMDQDFHPIRNGIGDIINPPAEIRFGDRVWIGCRATVLKGASVGDETVVAA